MSTPIDQRPPDQPPASQQQYHPDLVRSGPVCRTCRSVGQDKPCTDCFLRSGLHTHEFPPPSSALLAGVPPRWPAIAIVSCLVSLFVVGSLLTGIDRTVFGPDRTVGAFFSALQQRDGEAAIALIHDSADVNSASLLSTSAMVHDPGYQPPSSWTVHKIDGSYRNATVKVSYVVSGQRIEQEFSLTRVGYRSGVFSRWAIDGAGAMPALDVMIPSTGVIVAGAEFEPQGSLRFARVLPGSYSVSVPDNPVLSLHEQVVAKPDNDLSAAPVIAGLTSDAAVKVQAALRTELLHCATSHSLNPAGCPFSGTEECTPLGRPSWQLGHLPAVQVIEQPSPGQASPDGAISTLTLETDQSGTMRFNLNCSDGFGGVTNGGQEESISVEDWGINVSGQSISFIPANQ